MSCHVISSLHAKELRAASSQVSKELKPTASEELSAANNHMNATGSSSSLAKPDVDSSPSQHFATCDTLKQRTHLSHILAPDL